MSNLLQKSPLLYQKEKSGFVRFVKKKNKTLITYKRWVVGKQTSVLVSRRFGFLKPYRALRFFSDKLSTLQYEAKKHQAIKTLVLLKSYRGARHQLGFPVRGQSTRTNAKTRRKRRIQ